MAAGGPWGPVAMGPQAAATVQLVAAMVLLVPAEAATVLLEGVVVLLVGGAAVVVGVGVAACLLQVVFDQAEVEQLTSK